MCHIWRTIQLCFTRKSCLSLEEFSQAVPWGINAALMLCTYSTQSMNCGTSPLWTGTSLWLDSGQPFCNKIPFFLSMFVVFEMSSLLAEQALGHTSFSEAGHIWWTEIGRLPQ